MVELGPVKELITGIARFWSISHNIRLHDLRLERAERDHRSWFAERDRKLRKELRAVDTEMRQRGLFDSGIRLGARARVKAAAPPEPEDERQTLSDVHENVRIEETILERTYRRVLNKPIRSADRSQAEKDLEAKWKDSERDHNSDVEVQVDLDRLELSEDGPDAR